MLKGFYYLYLKETRRFTKIYGQTLIGPVITALLFLFVFYISLSSRYNVNSVEAKYNFLMFLIPGLIMMQVIQSSFANNSSSMLMAKMFGTIGNVFAAPLNEWEIVLAYILSSVTRGLMVAVALFIVMYFVMFFIHPIAIHHLIYSLYFIFISSFFMGALGLICGLWSKTFDKLSTITNLIITPLTFLSGTFYSVKQLPHYIVKVVYFNPVFYMIDGFRYAFSGIVDFSALLEGSVLLIAGILLYLYAVYLLKSGYNTKS